MFFGVLRSEYQNNRWNFLQQYPLKRCANAIGVPHNGTPLVPRLHGMLHEGDRKKPSVKYFKIHAVRGLKKKIGRELFSMCSI